MILWPHQAEAIEVCTSSFRRRPRSRTLVQFPTGTGKTLAALLLGRLSRGDTAHLADLDGHAAVLPGRG